MVFIKEIEDKGLEQVFKSYEAICNFTQRTKMVKSTIYIKILILKNT